MTDNLSGNARRYLALWLPLLPTDRLHRSGFSATSGGPAEAPLALTEKVKGALRLAAVDARGQGLGLHSGLTLADARSRVPRLAVMETDPAADARLLDRLADACDRYTPLVALDPPDGLILDITGCTALFGGEEALARDLRARLSRIGMVSRIGLAGTPDAARALARFAAAAGIADDGTVSLRGLPIAALDAPAETAAALARAGLKRIGDLAGRPSRPLAARFGEELVRRLRCVLGHEDRRITPRRPVPDCIVERAFADPIARQSDIEATLASLLEKACRMLEKRGGGGRLFEASFFRADGEVRRIAVAAGRPQRTPQTVMRLLREMRDALTDPLDPGFALYLIRLAVPLFEPLAQQQADFAQGERGDEDVAALTDRLVARFGRERVLRFAPNDTHDPLRAFRFVPAPDAGAKADGWPLPEAGEPPLRPLQLFAAPQRIEALAEVPDGPPLRFRWRGALHDVARAEGPERIAPEWWRATPETPVRDYYRVEDGRGRRFWLFRAGLYGNPAQSPSWFLHGLFA